MILCVGASGCGKTSLLKILKQKCVKENLANQESAKDDKKLSDEPQIPDTRYPAAISTVGTDILTLPGRGIYYCLLQISVCSSYTLLGKLRSTFLILLIMFYQFS